jgi:hypothetical protein
MAEGQSSREQNRRASPRTVIRQAATVVYGETTVAVQTFDLGRDGMCLVARRPIGPGTRCKVTFDLPLRDGPVEIAASIKVVYSSYVAAEEFKIGAVFTALDPAAVRALESFTADA